jgi:asparagine synthase (glutamine-hydrolysing)
LLEQQGLRALEEMDGQFVIVWWCAARRELRLIRDRFGAEPFYYAQNGNRLLFGSRIRDLMATGLVPRALSADGLAEFLVYCYLPGTYTLHEGVLRVPAGGSVLWSATRGVSLERWYALSFENPVAPDEAQITRTYRDALERAVTRRLGPADPGAFLSGGMDSSSAVTFARRHWPGRIESFGFRCSGASFDESVYARGLAEALEIKHTEVPFGEQESLDIHEAVPQMEVPFCDIGIEIGTWVLGRAARGHVEYVLTGDGGDEIWASHPVYAAQKLLRWYDALHVPRFLSDSVWRLASLLPDSDKKRNLPVILKRILPPPGIPRELKHFRWRAYYAPKQLASVLTADWARKVKDSDPFECVHQSFAGYRGPDDGMSPLLYSDYTTASGFYFSRLLLLRHFGVEARTPFYDRELVELGARIPAHLKLEGIERTKRLFRVAMKGVLPDVVNERKDKLGHSVPLKVWLRDSGALSNTVQAVLTREAIERRGLINYAAFERLLSEHRNRRQNHSHRLWALYVLELWLRAHMD